MIPILPLIILIICLISTLFITSKYEYKFAYPNKELLVDLIVKSQAFQVPEKPVKAEHREAPLYYKIEFSQIFEKGLQMELSKLMANFIRASDVTFDRLIGVGSRQKEDKPLREKYLTVPLLSAIMKKPYALIIEIVDSKKFICEGEIKEGETVIIIDEVLTTGKSVINAVKYLRENFKDIKIANVFTLIVRFPFREGGIDGAKRTLWDYGVELHTIIDNVELVETLYKRKYLTSGKLQQVLKDEDLVGSPVWHLKNPSMR
jgi:hypothetical protein